VLSYKNSKLFHLLLFFLFFKNEINAEEKCEFYDSKEEEYSAVQVTGKSVVKQKLNSTITSYDKRGEFSGIVSEKAKHEGLDLYNSNKKQVDVPIFPASKGEVVYVRLGCESSRQFSKNENLRECGAGWGNHIVIKHASGIYTRYAHLRPDGIFKVVGDQINQSDIIGLMGNSGRSEERHLHFEIGTFEGVFDSCGPSQSFDKVFDPTDYGI